MTIPDSIASELDRTYGIDHSVLGQAAIKSFVKQQCTQLKLKTDKEYFDYIQTSKTAFSNFVDSLLVPETWFFRDSDPFTWLQSWAHTQKGEIPHLRALSVPSSTGEETYSIAITLIEAGWLPEHFSVLGIDLSQAFIDKAKTGIYKQKSFRGNALEHYPDYFTETDPAQYTIKPNIQQCVSFQTANILDPQFLSNEDKFNIIFFRNVLIYFTNNARLKALDTINNLLAPNGVLIMGHADNLYGLTDAFVPAGPSSTFTYTRKENTSFDLPLKPLRSRKSSRTNTHIHPNYSDKTPSLRKNKDSQLALKARKYVDKGRIQDALDICQKHIADKGPSSDAYFLIGEIYSIKGHYDDAERSYRRALYMEKSHPRAQFQLDILKKRREQYRKKSNQ